MESRKSVLLEMNSQELGIIFNICTVYVHMSWSVQV